jgi:hypothetical protein
MSDAKSNEQILDEMFFCDKDGKEISGKNSQWVQWISVKDRLPEEYQIILVWDGKKVYPTYLSDWENEEKTSPVFSDIKNDLRISNITHWMRLPEAPKDEG